MYHLNRAMPLITLNSCTEPIYQHLCILILNTQTESPWWDGVLSTFCWVGGLRLPHHGFGVSSHVRRPLLSRRDFWVVRVVVRTEPGVLSLERLKLLGRLNPAEPGIQHTGMSGASQPRGRLREKLRSAQREDTAPGAPPGIKGSVRRLYFIHLFIYIYTVGIYITWQFRGQRTHRTDRIMHS